MQESQPYQHFTEDELMQNHKSIPHVMMGIPVKHYDPNVQGTVALGQQYDPSFPENLQIANPQDMLTTNQVPIGNDLSSQKTHEQETQASTIVAEKFGEVVGCNAQLLAINSREPQVAYCPKCKKYVQTVVTYHVGTGTILSAALLALLGAWMGCCLIPCCLKDCKDVWHHCPACNLELALLLFSISCGGNVKSDNFFKKKRYSSPNTMKKEQLKMSFNGLF